MNRFEKFDKLTEILGAEKVLEELVNALSESAAEELADYIAINNDIFLEITEDNVVEIVEDLLSKEIYFFNEKLEIVDNVPEDWELCDTVYEDDYISIEPLEDREREIKGFLIWTKNGTEEYKKKYYLKIKEA
jgi:hypothetical protein